MIKLPDVTLITLTGVNYQREAHTKAIEKSCEGIDFGAVKQIELPEIVDIHSWNKAVIYELPKYVQTSHCLFIHHDGYVIHPELWDDAWLSFDFIGAPWPLPKDDFSYRDEAGDLVRVGNSVSIRSKKLLTLAAEYPWQSFHGFDNEDGFIACNHRKDLERQGIVYAPLEVAVHFSKEHEIPENAGLSTFCFHSL
jgi:hypothetical protein